jgi:histidyl-tRNA synthetase
MVELRAVGLQEDLVQQIMEFANLKGRPDKVLSESPSRLEDEGRKGLEELSKLADILETFDKIERCIYDFRIVRGIGYYDGIVFEAYDRVGEDIGAIFAGGRYDGLCRIYGKRDMPATGVAGGVERIMISMERANLLPKISQAPTVFVVAVNDAARRGCWNITRQLRRMGVPADFDLKGRTLDKQLEYADSIGIPYTIIIGQRELERGVVKLRDMAQRVEKELTLQEAVKHIERPEQHWKA